MDDVLDIPPPSREQEQIIEAVARGHVVVDSVAGCGKTTTIIHAAQRYPQWKFLILMYNRRLKEESRRRVSQMALHNVEVQNFHSFFVRYYEGNCNTDAGVRRVLENDDAPKRNFEYDVIVVDEAQDMKLIFFRMLAKILADMQRTCYDPLRPLPRVMALGDKYQNVYKFLGSDERFLLYAPDIFGGLPVTDLPWQPHKMSISFRITRQIARFINHCALGYERIRAIRDGPPVQYIICNLFRTPPSVLKDMIARYGYENIFVVSNSVKSAKSPLRSLANAMSKAGIPIFVPASDDADIDEKVIAGKLVFTTYNQTKGLERECIMIFNIDEWNPCKSTECPNAIYVAMTRAKSELILLHSNTADYAPFIRRDKIADFANVQIRGKFDPGEHTARGDPPAISATELTEYLSGEVIERAMGHFRHKTNTDGCAKVLIPTTITVTVDATPADTGYDSDDYEEIASGVVDASSVETQSLYEDVSDITGVMIPTWYEYTTTGNIQIYQHLSVEARGIVYQPESPGADTAEDIARLLKMANVYNAHCSGYMHKLNQIPKYDWVVSGNLNDIRPRLRKHIGSSGNRFEVRVETQEPILGKRIGGAIDCISEFGADTDKPVLRVYEFKCTNGLKATHYIQLAIYAYLLETNPPDHLKPYFERGFARQYIILNLLTGKYCRIRFEIDDLAEMIEFLILNKYYLDNSKTDAEFMREIQDVQNEFEITENEFADCDIDDDEEYD